MHKTAVTANRNAGITNSQVAATRALLSCGVAAGLLSLLIVIVYRKKRAFFRQGSASTLLVCDPAKMTVSISC
jgi:hypothetical protein